MKVKQGILITGVVLALLIVVDNYTTGRDINPEPEMYWAIRWRAAAAGGFFVGAFWLGVLTSKRIVKFWKKYIR